MPTLTLNQVDPSKTLAIRKKYANQQRRIFAAAVASSQTALANLPENPTQNQIDNYLAALLALLMLNITSGNAIYPYVQAAYLRGVTNANLDLRAGGLSVIGAETAVLTQAVHRFSLQARQDSTQAMIRDVYLGTVNNVGNEISTGGERPLIDRVNGQLRKGMNLAITVGATAIVGIVADAFLNRVVDFGISLVSAVAEAQFVTAGDEKVCQRCLFLEQQDLGNGPGVYTIGQARGLIPQHPNCRCAFTAIVLGHNIPFLRF